ncbi:MAG: hypothetical protein A2X64_03945 [Ignavibacteria bacterium GWF2_33_9]|nr:MAG: hypothetical protein A2X64_03945 [Ignavibacteria bacterium GWF2_33_9]
MINYENALDIILDESKAIPFKTELINLNNSLGRIITEDVYSDVNLPPFTNSAMDGYAYKFSDGIDNYKIVGEITAGNFKYIPINEGECVLITTGSKIPDSCDTVVPVEDVKIEGENIHLEKFIPKFSNLRFKAEDIEINKLAVQKYNKISTQLIPILATCGKAQVNVLKKLKIGFLTSGNELIDISEKPENDKIRASNQYALMAQIVKAGCEPVSFGRVVDNSDELQRKLVEMLNSDCNILITTGGVSVGKYDLQKDIMQDLGIEFKFWKSNIKPGKPIVFGTFRKEKLVFGLPGNPLSSYIGFEIFVKPVINEYSHENSTNKLYAILENDLKKKDGKRHFKIGVMRNIDGINYVNNQLGHGSGNVYQMSLANCLAIMPEDEKFIPKGEKVECIMI